MIKALILNKNEDEKKAVPSIETINLSDFPEEDVLINISYSTILDESDTILKLMLVIEDVTELEILEKEVIESQEASALKVQRMQEIVSNNYCPLKK